MRLPVPWLGLTWAVRLPVLPGIVLWVVDHELVSYVVGHPHEREANGAFRVHQVVHVLTPVGAPGSGAG